MDRLMPEVAAHAPRFIRNSARVALLAAMGLCSLLPQPAQSATTQTSVAQGGFVEKTNSTSVRPPLTSTQMQSLLPARGAFVFLDQRLPVGDRNLIIVGMDFREGQEAMAVAAIFHEGRLQ